MSKDSKGSAAADAQTTPQPNAVTTRGQRHVAPVGRHSQKTHRQAEERAAGMGNTNEKEQHAHDRNALSAKLTQRAEDQQKQASQQSARTAKPKAAAEEAPKGDE